MRGGRTNAPPPIQGGGASSRAGHGWPVGLATGPGGAEGIRPPDPLHAMQVRYQLRHSPRSGAARVRATPGILAGGPHRLPIGGLVPEPHEAEMLYDESRSRPVLCSVTT